MHKSFTVNTMEDIEKKYRILCTSSVMRHPAVVNNFYFHKRIETETHTFGLYETYEEAEKAMTERLNDTKRLNSFYVSKGLETLEIDKERNIRIIKEYHARHRDYLYSISNVEIKRKKEPYFTHIIHYSIVETYQLPENPDEWKNDPWSDRRMRN